MTEGESKAGEEEERERGGEGGRERERRGRRRERERERRGRRRGVPWCSVGCRRSLPRSRWGLPVRSLTAGTYPS